MKQECQHCMFSEKEPNAEGSFICKRFPPRPIMVPYRNAMTNEAGMAVQSFFSTVGGEDHCGEYAPVVGSVAQ